MTKQFTLKDTPFHFLLNMFYKYSDRLGFDKAIKFMEAIYPEWQDHYEDIMLTYDYNHHLDCRRRLKKNEI